MVDSKKIIGTSFLVGTAINSVSGSAGFCKDGSTDEVLSAGGAVETFDKSLVGTPYEKASKMFDGLVSFIGQETDKEFNEKANYCLYIAERANKEYIDADEDRKAMAAVKFLGEMEKIYNEVKAQKKILAFKRMKDIAEYAKKLQEEKDKQLDERNQVEYTQAESKLNEEDWAGILKRLKAYDEELRSASRVEVVKSCYDKLQKIKSDYDSLLKKQREREAADLSYAKDDFIRKNSAIIEKLSKDYSFDDPAKERKSSKEIIEIHDKYKAILSNLSNLVKSVETYDDMTLFDNVLNESKADLERIKEREDEIILEKQKIKDKNKLIRMFNDFEELKSALAARKVRLDDVVVGRDRPKKISKVFIAKFRNYIKGRALVPAPIGMVFQGKPGTGKSFGLACIFSYLGCEVATVKITDYLSADGPRKLLDTIERLKSAAKSSGKILVVILDDVDGSVGINGPLYKTVSGLFDTEEHLGRNSFTRYCITCNRGLPAFGLKTEDVDEKYIAREIVRPGRCDIWERVEVMNEDELLKLVKNRFNLYGVSARVDPKEVVKLLMREEGLRTPAKVSQLLNTALELALEEKRGGDSWDVDPTDAEHTDDINEDELDVSIEKRHVSAALQAVGAGPLE